MYERRNQAVLLVFMGKPLWHARSYLHHFAILHDQNTEHMEVNTGGISSVKNMATTKRRSQHTTSRVRLQFTPPTSIMVRNNKIAKFEEINIFRATILGTHTIGRNRNCLHTCVVRWIISLSIVSPENKSFRARVLDGNAPPDAAQ